jgi:hypothetical protein
LDLILVAANHEKKPVAGIRARPTEHQSIRPTHSGAANDTAAKELELKFRK